MKQSSKFTAIFLIALLVAIGIVTMRYALSGPTFRAADHATYDECIASVPREWRPGSLERTRAEAACHYEMEQRLQRGGQR
jgi:hypothetical protein